VHNCDVKENTEDAKGDLIFETNQPPMSVLNLYLSKPSTRWKCQIS